MVMRQRGANGPGDQQQNSMATLPVGSSVEAFFTRCLRQSIHAQISAYSPAEAMACSDAMRWALCETRWGWVGVALHDGALCHVGFYGRTGRLTAEKAFRADVQRDWPRAACEQDSTMVLRWCTQALAHMDRNRALRVVFRGTEFQCRVWRALLDCPSGATCSYGALAQALGYPTSVRAVASAIGANRLAVVTPCHRVVRQNGDLGGFRWGLPLKEQFLAEECQLSVQKGRPMTAHYAHSA